MSKLCQCRRVRIWAIMDKAYAMRASLYEFNDVNDAVNKVEYILESDCVCEKKEIRNLDCPNKCTVDEAVDRGCLYCAHKAVYGSKQSQFPCEHEWEETWTLHGLDGGVHKKLFCCLKPKCGLVTCVDPSRSAHSLNPNQ